MGERDFIISNPMTNQQASKFTNPTLITDPIAGHDLPASGSSQFASVVAWMTGGEVAPTPAPPPSAGPCESWCEASYCSWAEWCGGCSFC